MKKKRKAFVIFAGLVLAAQLGFEHPAAAQEGTVDVKTIERLERLIQEQQKQLEALQQQVNQLKQTAERRAGPGARSQVRGTRCQDDGSRRRWKGLSPRDRSGSNSRSPARCTGQ